MIHFVSDLLALETYDMILLTLTFQLIFKSLYQAKLLLR